MFDLNYQTPANFCSVIKRKPLNYKSIQQIYNWTRIFFISLKTFSTDDLAS